MQIKRSHFILWLVVGVFGWMLLPIWLPILILVILCTPYMKVHK